MRPDDYLLLAGASVRAAAFSALRAGLRPWCVDLFADADLQGRCPAVALPTGRYPQGFVEAFAGAPAGPWLYTGGLENRPELVRQLSRCRPLWGNGAAVLRKVRSPWRLAALLKASGVPHPAVCRYATQVPPHGPWLVKRRDGAGGRGIRFYTAGQSYRGPIYFQEYMAGVPCAALYVSDGSRARLLGMTRQLVGEPWLNAAPFQYCGSVGPLAPAPAVLRALLLLGNSLVAGFGLRGLFGVDCVLRAGIPHPVEVNPRYTASVEVLEHGTGAALLALHRRVFDAAAPAPAAGRPTAGITGKAVLFARRPLDFPAEGPWTATLRRPAAPWDVPAFADIPHAGTRIAAGRPVLSFFARAGSVAACMDELQRIAADLDRHLCG
jgi:predicted ATP-grasp superfamily ATP-dependent carboligase